MNKLLLLLLTTILSFNCYSQISFEKGYYINNAGEKVNALIKNLDWENNPTEFEYKLSENSESKKATIKSIKEFGIDNISKYIRSTVNIDRSSERMKDLSANKNPEFKEEVLFLNVLIEGKANLYEYVDGDLTRYFYNIEDSNIEQLIFKSYKTSEISIGKNNRFRQQLWHDLKCSDFKISQFENLDYKKNALIDLFVEYNKCNHQEYVSFEENQKRDFFNLSIRPRINRSSLTVEISSANYNHADFGNKIGFGFGMEAEFILPTNRNKWAIAVEPTYQSFEADKTTNESIIGRVNYSSIEIPLSLRHYFFLNENSKIFINASYIFDFSSKSSIEYKRSEYSSLNSFEIKSRPNFGFGIGYKQDDKYSLEMRYQTGRDLLSDYITWNSEYKTISIILGYSLF